MTLAHGRPTTNPLSETRPSPSLPLDLESIRAPKMAEVVATRLRRRIVRGELKAGDFLPSEAVLVAQMGISRPVLREALRILEAEALLRIRRGAKGGAEVRAPQVDVVARYLGLLLQSRGVTVGDVFRARIAFEPLAARLLATRASRESIDILEAILDEERRHLENPRMFARTVVRFDEELVRLCGNEILAVFGGMLTRLIEQKVDLSLDEYLRRFNPDTATMRRDVREVHERHVRLLKLVKSKKPAQAEAHWRGYLEKTLARYLPEHADSIAIDVLR